VISLQESITGPQQATECGAHGPYVSTWWTIPMPDGGKCSSWTGCPVCIREREQQKRGYGKARFRYPHRPSYDVVVITNGTEKRFEEKS
jgi:hypothetical protein